ncbi:MAG: hypothetical protein J5911_05315 [Clostridia bacterium]|nr:hypothetical protein [Clostridia bacterium]
MEISDIIKNFISNNDISALKPIFDLLRENSFDLKKTLGSITPETLMRLSGDLLKSGAKTAAFNAEKNGVSPIANIADKDIVYVLNRYINAER